MIHQKIPGLTERFVVKQAAEGVFVRPATEFAAKATMAPNEPAKFPT